MSDFDEADLRQKLKGRVPEYSPEFAGGDVTIELCKSRRRRFSQIYQYSIRANEYQRNLFVKVPIEAAAQSQASSSQADVGESRSPQDRPRLVPVMSVLDEVRLEHAALARMGDHFGQCNDSRLGIPRVLDLLEGRAIVVESVECPTLDQLLRRERRVMGSPRGDDLQPAFRNAGLWLRTFHQLPVGKETQLRLTSRDELLDSVAKYVSYLGGQIGVSRRLDRIGQQLQHHIRNEMPAELPRVCGHGDFGLHNLFVTDSQRVIGFDTLAYWQTSPYEDVAYFLLLLETLPPLFLRRSWMTPARVVTIARKAFLEGFFDGEQIPHRRLVSYEALVALDKWASAVHSCRRASGLRGQGKRGRLVLQQHLLRSRIEELLGRLESESSPSPSLQENDSAP